MTPRPEIRLVNAALRLRSLEAYQITKDEQVVIRFIEMAILHVEHLARFEFLTPGQQKTLYQIYRQPNFLSPAFLDLVSQLRRFVPVYITLLQGLLDDPSLHYKTASFLTAHFARQAHLLDEPLAFVVRTHERFIEEDMRIVKLVEREGLAAVKAHQADWTNGQLDAPRHTPTFNLE